VVGLSRVRIAGVRDQARCLPQSYFQVLHIHVGSTHEGIKQASLDVVLIPDSRCLESNTLLWRSGARIASRVENSAVLEVTDVLHELDDGLS
jgi:hypothetical protein